MKSAIIIVDVLQDFFREGRPHEHQKALVENINALTGFGRQQSVPIIWVRQEFKKDLSDAFLGIKKGLTKVVTIEGTEGARLLSDLITDSNDHEIIKKRYSAFFRTDLDALLEKLEVNTLILAGVNTHACVRMAAIDAYQRDYEVLLATDCIDSYDEEHGRVSLEYLSRVIARPKSNTELFAILSL